MNLSKAKEFLKKPKNSNLIKKGKDYQSRLRMYTEALSEEQLKKENAFTEFDKFLQKVLSEKKHSRIKDFIRYPLTSVDISESIMTEIYKVFDASNSYFNYDTGKDTEGKIDKVIRDNKVIEFIKHNGKEVLKNKPNSVVVIDKDKEKNPYLLLVENERIVDFNLTEEGKFEYISFIHSITEKEENGKTIEEIRIAFYCDEFYRVFLKKDDDFIKEIENAHKIGYCPCRFFIEDEITPNDCFSKKIPLTSVLSKLEDWQIFDIYKFYTDHYAPFPVIEKGEEKCSNDSCKGGMITVEDTYYEDDIRKTREIFKDCPVCKDKKITGPGTIISVPARLDKEDPTEAGLFRFISPDITSLKYLGEKLTELEDYIFMKSVGTNDLLDTEAVNKLQVKGSFETKKSVLLKIKPNFDNLYKWILETLNKVTNGPNSTISVACDFGTEFHLVSEEEMQKRYDNAKKIGLPEAEIDTLYMQLIDTKYKNNPDLVDRMWLIKIIDPCPYDTLDQKIRKFELGIITEQEFVLTTRLMKLVERFEIEQIDLVSYGKLLTLREKLSKIKVELTKYADEHIKTKSLQRSGSEGTKT